jgi:hypothetical protein
MSIDPFDNTENGEEPSQKVTDDEGTVDDRVKNRILKARERIDTAEAALYVDAPTSDTGITEKQQYLGYQAMVRQYIRAIKPLLTSEKIPQAEHYHSEVLLYEDMVAPPDSRRFKWSRFANDEIDDTKIKMEMGLRYVDPPKPKRVSVEGLNEILTKDEISAHWSFDLLDSQGVAKTDVEHLDYRVPVPKRVYDSAVEQADAFLQQAGIGLEIGHREEDDPDTDPF